MKIVDAYVQFGLYNQWNEAVTKSLADHNQDSGNNDLFLAVCEQMEIDETDYPIEQESDCPEYLSVAAEKAFKRIKI
ncbi:MAG: hypothetical protein ACOC0U_05825 [Desulfovibrionales bacterium]